MDAHNISVCVAPSLFHKLDRPNDVETSLQTISFVRLLIENIETLFGKPTIVLLKAAADSLSKNNNNNNNNSNSGIQSIVDYQHKQHLASTTASIASSVLTATTTTTVNSTNTNNELDTDSNDGHNNDSSIDDVIGTSSEIEILDLAHSLANKNQNPELNSLLTQSLTGPAAILATQSLNNSSRGHIKTNLLTTSNHHDFSSNTLSVDSGLSVPTATSDPESEKSSESAAITAKQNENTFKQQQQINNKEPELKIPTKTNIRSLSAREEAKESTNELKKHFVDDTNGLRVVKNEFYYGDENMVGSLSASTLATSLDNNSLQTKKIYKKVSNNTLNSSNKKYTKKNSTTIMKQFSESDVFYESTALKDDIISNNREQSFNDYVNKNNSNDNSSLSKDIDDKSQSLSKSAINLKSYTTVVPQQQQQQQKSNLINKKSLLKVNLEKSFNQIQSNVLKGINMGLGLASDIISTLHSSSGGSNNNSNSFQNNNDNISSPRTSSSVYIPQTSATLTKVNIIEKQHQSTATELPTNIPAQANASTMTTTRRKVSKTKDDYKPSRQFVENLQATQRNRNYSATSSTGSSISRNSSRESSLSDDLSIKRSNSNNLIINDVQNNREQYKRSKRTRNKNSVLRAKSFNYQTTSSPIEAQNNKNPNLTASIYTNFNDHLNNKRNVRRSVSLKNYTDNSSQYDKQPVTKIIHQQQNPITKIVTHNSSNISKVDTSSISNSSATPTTITTSINDLQKVPNTSITSFIELKSAKQQPDVTPDNSSFQNISKVYTSNNQTKPATLSRSTNLQDYRPLCSPYNPSTSKSISSLTANSFKDTFNNATLGGIQSLSSTLPGNRSSISGNQDQVKALNEFKNGMLTTLPTSTQDLNLVNVTWSVSNIRKQFEQNKQLEENNGGSGGSYRQLVSQQPSLNTPPTTRKPIQSISSMFQIDQQLKAQHIKARANSTNSPEQTIASSTTNSNNYLSTVKINRSKNVVNFKDIYGNPTTYI